MNSRNTPTKRPSVRRDRAAHGDYNIHEDRAARRSHAAHGNYTARGGRSSREGHTAREGRNSRGSYGTLGDHNSLGNYTIRGGYSTATHPSLPFNPRLVGLAVAAVVLVVALAFAFSTCSKEDAPADNDAAAASTAEAGNRVSFVAVGDNLPNETIGQYADSLAGEAGDGTYDYAPIYEPLKPYVESADLAYIKQETHLGGDDIGPRGWPSFNTTDAMADAVVSTGFDLVASATNHSYDWGTFGAIEHSRSVWDTKPVAFTGTAANEQQAAELATVERNGITFALLDYTYGVNGFTQADLPPYAVNFIDEERIRTDVARAKEAADVVLVAMHWGTENLMEADEDQLHYAQLLADLEVDVVLGSHPHVIGPLGWVEGSTGHKTLVAYSLGNFLSCHETPGLENELEGMLCCDFVRNDDGAVSIENVVWRPLVNHTAENDYRVFALRDYTPELAGSHVVLSALDNPIDQLRSTTTSVIGDGFTIDM
ncbi:CapA family protein [Adlercreutzia sp. ZJ141]|uniref:CapA family protein n=1 Tax=Adlercreutzia sp. ZJ141 TaxID=2709406 RepID=UPI0013EDE504|nr:CapA family protein [Adlercreutzia sp. ZJ141]